MMQITVSHSNNSLAENMEIDNEPSASQETNENMHNMATEDEATSSTSDTLHGWSKLEKYYLYLGIKLIGSKNVKEIHELISKKTLQEVEAAIAYYMNKANEKPECTNRKMKIRKVKIMPTIPLASWAKVLTDHYDYSELQTEVVGALRLIADLDNITPASFTEHIDFRQIYHHITYAMEGKSLPRNYNIAEVLHCCIIETALYSKQFINLNTLRNIISTINFNEKPGVVLTRPTKSCELAIVRHLASQENYNPLGIPVDSLLPMSKAPIV